MLTIPVVAVGLWQLYILVHFGVSPSSQAHGILGAPFAAWFDYFLSGLRGNHLLIGRGRWAYAEALMLSFFLVTLLLASWLALLVLVKRWSESTAVDRSVAILALVLALLYTCFGRTVAMHYSGYLKAATIFSFLIPLMLPVATIGLIASRIIIGFLLMALIAGSFYNWNVRILPSFWL